MHIMLFIFSSFQLYKYYKADDTDEEIDDFKKNIKIFIKERAPYGFHELQSALYLNAIIIIMGFLVKDEDLAIYRSIQIIIVPISILPMIFSQVLLKQLSENIDNIKYFKSLFRKFSLVAFASGLTLFFLFYFQGSWIVDLFYGNKFNELDYINELLLIFASTYLFRFISANYGVLITAKDKQKIRVYATSALVVVTVVSTIILTKSMGIIGAAYANAVSYFVIMVIYVVYSEFKLLRE
jgi:O-antigen/teichoic acid export membrane protein